MEPSAPHSNMDSYDTLYRRTIELAVEAKFHRAENDRLSNTIVHLASFAAESRSILPTTEIKQLQIELATVRAELASLRFNRIIGWGNQLDNDPTISELSALQLDRVEQTLARTASPANPSGGHHSDSPGERSRSSQKIEEDLLGWDDGEVEAMQGWSPPLDLAAQTFTRGAASPIERYEDAGRVMDIQRASLPTIVDRPFHDHERRKIIGFATWIEDWTEDEVDAGWEEFANVNPSHSSIEWRRFYKTVVRPHLVEKGQIQDQTGTDGSFFTSEESNDGGPVGQSNEPKVLDEPKRPRDGELVTFADVQQHEDESLITIDADPGIQEARAENTSLENASGISKEVGLIPSTVVSEDTGSTQLSVKLSLYPDSLTRLRDVEDTAADAERLRSLTAGGSDNSGDSKIMTGHPSSKCEISREVADLSESRRASRTSAFETSQKLHRIRSNNGSKSLRGLEYSRWRPERSIGSCGRDVNLPRNIWPGENQDVPGNLKCSDISLQYTVLISGIEPGTTLSWVLDRVYGGRIVSAAYIETSKRFRSVATDVVMVVFFDAAHARAYVDFCAENATSLKAAMVESPTFSCALKKRRALGSAQNTTKRSRVLCLYHPFAAMTPLQALSDLQNLDPYFEEASNQPLKMKHSETGAILIEFSSVDMAHRAKEAFEGPYSTLDGFSKGFAADPCELPLHEVTQLTVHSLGIDQGDGH